MKSYGSGPRHVVFVGAVHGNGAEMSSVADRVEKRLEGGAAIAPDLTVHVIRQLNPDGALVGVRENANGVDLNRNFPATNFVSSPVNGSAPLSEPESSALANVIDQTAPAMVIVGLHTQYDPFVDYDGPDSSEARRLASRLGFAYSSVDSGPPTPGSIGNWFGRDRGRDAVFVALDDGSDVGDTADGILELLSA